jgi:hypothetical protein
MGMPIFKVRENGNVEFWVSHGIILLSTVLGVYLAAQAGYKTAVEFEVSRSDREGYYMRRALRDEVNKNLEWADMVSNAIIKDFRASAAGQKPQTFVWETMKQQSVTFQLSPQTLSSIREFYDNAESHVKEMTPIMYTGKMQEAENWKKEAQKMRETVLVDLDKDMEQLRKELTARGVAVK